jgi:aquaporin related protein
MQKENHHHADGKNQSVTLGMVAAGQLPWFRGLILFPAQILGGIVAAALVSCMLPGDIGTTRTVLAAGMSHAQGLFFEMFLTAFLVFTVLMLAAEKSKDTFIAPIGIGLALFVAEIAGKKHFCTPSSLLCPFFFLPPISLSSNC